VNNWNNCENHYGPDLAQAFNAKFKLETFKANINLVFIVVVKPPKSLTKPMVSGIFLTQKVSTTNQHPSFHF
jgi:hypothetical protein